jgi:hypothetical protein
VAVVAASWENPSLLGWARVAALLSEPGGAVSELVVAAPVIGSSTHDLAVRTPALAPALRLVALPSLAESPDEPYVQDVFPAGPGRSHSDTRTILDRVVRVIEGAAALTGVGAVRAVPGGVVLYLRGVRVLGLVNEGEAVSVTFLEPDRRHVHVSESNFPRWGVDLHEQVVQLAQDPRLLGRREVERDGAIEAVAAEARVQVTAHWLPWNREGRDPIEWVGVDASGRPVLGLVRRSIGLADVGPVTAALAILREDGGLWVPGSTGRPRVLLSCSEYDRRFEEALAVFDASVERAGEPSEVARSPEVARSSEVARSPEPLESSEPLEPSESLERDRRPRRRTRRRRRPRGESSGAASSGAREAPAEARRSRSEEPAGDGDFDLPAMRPEPMEAEQGRDADTSPFDDETPESAPEFAAEARSRAEEETLPQAEEETPPARARGGADEGSPVVLTEVEDPETEPAAEPDTESGEGSDVDIGEDTLAVVRGDEATEDVEEEALVREPPRPRRPRAALVVRNDFDSVLAALVLARERRNVVLFWVCRQEELMDFFKTGATDLTDSVDILLVGFTAQPVPKEVLTTAELYRGRIQWFDHHAWPIEDLELLREAVGRDAIVIAEGAASPLAAVMQVAERRSRFTDKLIDFAGRRLSENDMEKWGYALAALLRRLTETSGDYRADVAPILTGKPVSLPEPEEVYAEEKAWLEEHDPRVVHFGEYRMSVVHVPEPLDPGEVARRARVRTGTRLSLASREGDETVLLVANEEKRHINVQGLADYLAGRLSWVEPRPSGDRAARLLIEDLPRHPERLDLLVSEIARHKSVLYG